MQTEMNLINKHTEREKEGAGEKGNEWEREGRGREIDGKREHRERESNV